jgi:carboxypeptidase family protein
MAGYERHRYSIPAVLVLMSALACAGCEKGAASRMNPAAPSSSMASAPKTFVISGIVLEPSGRPIAGARIQVIASPHTFSDEHGGFTMPGVSAGRELLEVTKDGYQSSEQQIVVANDMQMTITLVAMPSASAAAVIR